MALSKNRIKYIRSLELKKNRKADKVFLAEGPKLVGDLLGHFRCRFLIATAEWLSAHRHLAVEDVTEVSEEELSRASLLKTPQQVLAVFEQPDESVDVSVISRSFAWHWTMCRTPAIWEQSSALPTGLESNISSVRPTRWMSIILKPYRLPWAASHG